MRKVVVNRDTSETQIAIELNLDGTGKTEFDTGLPFLEHIRYNARHYWNLL